MKEKAPRKSPKKSFGATRNKRPAGKIRIMGGSLKGRTLKVVDKPGLRPTPSIIRETFFNWLSPYIHKACVLDLFAGTGALGLEAISRGAEHSLFIEKDPKLAENLIQTLLDWQVNQQVNQQINQGTVLKCSALSWLDEPKKIEHQQPFDIIFIDPPFEMNKIKSILAKINHQKELLLTESTIICLENSAELTSDDIPESWTIEKYKKRGDNHYHLIFT